MKFCFDAPMIHALVSSGLMVRRPLALITVPTFPGQEMEASSLRAAAPSLWIPAFAGMTGAGPRAAAHSARQGAAADRGNAAGEGRPWL